MSSVNNAPGKSMVVKINASVLKSSTFRRRRTAGRIPLPTSGLTADADNNYEVPHDAGMITTEVTITSIYDQDSPHTAAPFNLRAGTVVTAQFGMTAALLTPAIFMVVMDTTDENDAEKTGLWEAVLMPSDDDTAGYYV